MDSSTHSLNDTIVPHWSLIKLVSVFALIFFTLQWGYQATRESALEQVIIDEATVKPSVVIINWLAPAEQVQANGPQLVSPTTRLSVLNGCEGTESLFLIIAAILAYRCPWRHKLIGLLTGTMLIYSLNQGRIVGLYFALRYDQTLFSALHGYIGPTLIIALGCLFFMGWMQWSTRTTLARS